MTASPTFSHLFFFVSRDPVRFVLPATQRFLGSHKVHRSGGQPNRKRHTVDACLQFSSPSKVRATPRGMIRWRRGRTWLSLQRRLLTSDQCDAQCGVGHNSVAKGDRQSLPIGLAFADEPRPSLHTYQLEAAAGCQAKRQNEQFYQMPRACRI